MRGFIKKVIHPFFRVITKLWFSKPRKYSYKKLSVTVHPEVFPPHYTISTKILLDFISTLSISKKDFLELGCGSGIISLYAASKKANVTAVDINVKAIEYLKKSALKNNLSITVIYSDLFSELKDSYFDLIVINPPYYPKDPQNQKEQAWFCGVDFEYFKQLFHELSKRKKTETVYMILSEDCDLAKIKDIALNHHFEMKIILEKKVFKERNFIFQIIKNKKL